VLNKSAALAEVTQEKIRTGVTLKFVGITKLAALHKNYEPLEMAAVACSGIER
jgi:hypothetical protein